MKTRVITAVVAVAVFLPFLIFSDTPAFTVCILLLSLIAAFEMLRCIGLSKNFILSLASYAYTAGAVILARGIDELDRFLVYMLFSTVVYMFILIAASLFSRGRVPIDGVSELFMMMFYIAITFSCILLIRDSRFGGYLYLIVFVAAWLTDSGAYFSGMALGKHKLIPDVSPKKTVEGAIGGIIVCILSMLVYALVIDLIIDVKVHYGVFVISGMLLSVVAMIGDLVMSLLKRKYNIKDYGRMFPGHGGVLDRFDSVIACAPFLMLLIRIVNFID